MKSLPVTCLCVAFLACSVIAADRPNVLLICVDDLKPLLGCYGDKTARTLSIDALANRSLLFRSAYCNQAVCSPSRNALMTGLRPQTLGIYELSTHFRKTAPDAITVAQHFQQAGYRTEGLGKILHRGHGNIEDAASWTIPHWIPKASTYQAKASTENMRPKKPGDLRGAATESAPIADDAYADGLLAVEAVKRIEAAATKPDEPFFIAVGFIRPHLPFVAPQKYWDLYDPATLPMPEVTSPPEGAPSYALQFGGELRAYSDMPVQGEIDEPTTRRLIHGYYAATSYMDAQVGKVVEALDQSGLADNTIIVLWGDHGWHLGDHSMWCKHTNYEQAARIPLLIAAPGMPSGAVTNAFIETVDLYPTLAELAGLRAPKDLDGISQVRVLQDPATSLRDSVIHVYPRGGRLGRAIRTARYRLVEWKAIGADPSSAEFELYDYETDPLETRNLASAQPETVAQLRAILATHPEARPQYRESKSGASEPPPTKPKKDRESAFKKRDQDGDGRLTLEEFLLNQPDPGEAPKRFPVFDKNSDGTLSVEEYVKSGK